MDIVDIAPIIAVLGILGLQQQPHHPVASEAKAHGSILINIENFGIDACTTVSHDAGHLRFLLATAVATYDSPR
ncbi:MAG: hypothetical protein AAGF11_12415 [Myxococcota bacterium]